MIPFTVFSEKIDEEAENYCALHSPPRRRKFLKEKVEEGMAKINSLKQIEKTVEDGSVTLPRKLNGSNTTKASTKNVVKRSASMSLAKKSSSSTSSEGQSMARSQNHDTKPFDTDKCQLLAKRVTFKSNLEANDKKFAQDANKVANSNANFNQKKITGSRSKDNQNPENNSEKRSSSLPRSE